MGSVDWTDTLRRLEAAKGDPKIMALTTVDLVVGQNDRALQTRLEAAAVPHWFTQPMLRTLVDDGLPESDGWFETLTGLTMVERFHAHAAWNVHEVTRLAIRERLASEQPARFREISLRAASLMTDGGDAYAIERVYHLLCADAGTAASELRKLWTNWLRTGQTQPLQALAKQLDELCGFQPLLPKARAYALLAIAEIQRNRFAVAAREKLARESLDLMKAVGDDLGASDAARVLGRVVSDAGKLAAALALYEEAAALLDRHSGDVDSSEMADRRIRLRQEKGRTLEERGLIREALTEYDGVLAFCIDESEQFPDDLLRREALSAAHADFGDALSSASRFADAESHFATALQIVRSCVSPLFGAGHIDRSISHMEIRLGDLLSNRGRLADAARQYDEAGEIAAALVRSDPENFGHQNDLAQTHNRRASVHFSRKDPEAAERHWTTARSMFAELNQRDPSNPNWKRNLAAMSSQFGKLRRFQGRWADSLREFQGAEQLTRELLEAEPDRAELQIDLSSVQNELVDIARTVLDSFPDTEANSDEKAPFVYVMMNNIVAASNTVQTLVERDTGNVVWRNNLAWTESLLAGALETLARHVEAGLKLDVDVQPTALRNAAIQRYVASMKAYIELSNLAPDNTVYLAGLSSTTFDAGRLLIQMDEREGALQVFQTARQATQRLTELDSDNTDYPASLAKIQEVIAVLEGGGSTS
ncbi:MAG TPA: hypothetical protein VH417_17500 [Vicinamibacterales bacterium]